MAGLAAGSLNRKLRIERPIADTSFDGAGSGPWGLVGRAWANVQDMLPSRGEQLADGVNLSSRPARVRLRFRTDITSDMRFVLGDRVMQIVAGPAELGHREGLEFMVEDYSAPGNTA